MFTIVSFLQHENVFDGWQVFCIWEHFIAAVCGGAVW